MPTPTPPSIDPFDRLARVVRELRTVVAPAQIIRVVADAGLDGMGALGAALGVTSSGGQVVVHVAGPALRDELTSIALFAPGRDGPIAAAIAEPKDRWFATAAEARRGFPSLPGTAGEAGAVLSLVTDEHSIGAIAVAFAQPRRLSADERAYLQAVAGAATLALGACGHVGTTSKPATEKGTTPSMAITRRVLTRLFAVTHSLASTIERHRLTGDVRQELVSLIDEVDAFSASLRKQVDERD